jgi:hypothetical protein
MSTLRRIQANRLNAQRSTGPRTPAGKRKSRLNAVRHGLACSDRSEFSADEQRIVDLVCAGDADPAVRELAGVIAEAQISINRVRLAKVKAFEAARVRYVPTHPLEVHAEALFSISESLRSGDPKALVRGNKLLGRTGREFRRYIRRLPQSMIDQPLSPRPESVAPRDDVAALILAQPELRSLDRYERRANARRNRAIAQLDAVRHLSSSGQHSTR